MVMNAELFLNALESIEVEKGISKETVVNALIEAMTKGFKKQLGGDDAEVVVNIDPEKGIIEMFHVKNIVEDVEDDFLEVSVEDAKVEVKEGKGEIREDKIYYPVDAEDLRKATAMAVKSILKQKFAEEEKNILYAQFQDKINTMITGKVEKADERGVSVNIGRTSVYLPHNQLIGDERFNPGDPIRLFVSDVATNNKGAHIVVSRANEGFLNCLFNEEIREIYDGTIVIKSIAREAGERSKVAVWTNNPDVDPAGACIGQNGTRIQKIVSQLGNGNSKEKIDIIAYSDNPGLYVMEALKPAHVVGVILPDETKKEATAIVKDDSLSLAIGRKGVNARLAVRLTGYKIDIKTESDALSEGLTFQTLEELQLVEMERKNKAAQEARLAALAAQASAADVLPGLPEGYVAPQARVYAEEEITDMDEAIESQLDKEEIAIESAPAVEEVKEVVAPVKEEVKVEEQLKVEVKAVKTTTTLEDLEKNLEEESKKKASKNSRKSYNHKKRDDEEDESDVAAPITNDPSKYMSIYTEEELAEIEAEEAEDRDISDDEDVDYDEYDDYYDDDNR